MNRPGRIALALLLSPLLTATASAQWVTFSNETTSRLSAPASLVAGDTQEKDYAWGDVDQDGDDDLIIARKQPWTTTGRFPNVLLMNEAGVLTDRTGTLANASLVTGSSGFLDATNDRDVALADVNGDGWLDCITSTTLSGSQPKYISHPRIYINQGNNASGVWQGFLFDDENRVPTMPAEPRFCAVSTGDVDGDGDVDLYFGDYQQGGPRPVDLNDRLWINDGTGYFTDQTSTRMTAVMVESSFGMATAIADMNGDGKLDVIKDDALNAPQGVSISYNDGTSQGFFASYEVPHNFAPYHVTVGDLNNDNKMDMVVTDDNADRYRLNIGNGSDGLANFQASLTFTFTGGGFDDGFGGNSVIEDLNNDGWNDVIITDVDVDIPGCSRRTHIYRNLGNAPSVTLQEQQIGSSVTGIPTSMLTGSHDVAVLDINGDGWKDLVLGRCSGTQVWINQPPTGLAFAFPQGLPFFVTPGQPFTFQVQVNGIGGTIPAGGSGLLHHRPEGTTTFTTVAMTDLGGGLYEATLPALANCMDRIEFYVSAQDTSGSTFSDPSTAPGALHEAVAADGTAISFEDDFEGSVAGWTVVNHFSLTSGAWEQAIPIGTILNGQFAAPSEDAEAGTQQVKCMVTQNGNTGGSAGASDVDGGPTDLISPVLDLAGTDATITYSRWFFSSGTDVMTVWVTADGTTWSLVESVGGNGNNQWQVASFRVSDYVTPTANVQVRFRTSDNPNNSITEAAVDVFRVEEFLCSVCQPDIGFGGPGNATLSVCGGDLSSGTTADITLTGGPLNGITYTLATTTLSPFPVGLGTIINPAPFFVLPVATDITGSWVVPGLPGGGGPATIYIQTGWFEATLPGGIGLSNGVAVNFLP